MLDIFNALSPFFKNCAERINVREYARRLKISPPTASTTLKSFAKQGLLIEERERIYVFYRANQRSFLFIELSRSYWRQEFERVGLLKFLEEEYFVPTIILFGSLSKAEVGPFSDIDLAIFSSTTHDVDLSKFGRILGRPIHVFNFRKLDENLSEGLLYNIHHGHLLVGGWYAWTGTSAGNETSSNASTQIR